MQHCDDQDLALRALGEPLADPTATASVDSHLSSCARCQSELDQLKAVITTARAVTPDDQPVSPPPQVWDRIAAELGLDEPLAPWSAQPAAPQAAEAPVAPVTDLTARRRRRSWGVTALVAAAVTGLFAGVLGVNVLQDSRQPAVMASATLAPLPDRTGVGSAEVLRTRNGALTVSVDVRDLPREPDGFYEVWLLTPDAKDMVSLGVLGANEQGAFDVPSGLDMTKYRVVDVSLEPLDGKPTHSGDSFVRGQLRLNA